MASRHQVSREASSSSSAADPTRLDAPAEGPEALLFTGNTIRELTSEQLTALGEFAARMFGVEMRQVQSVERELGRVLESLVQAEAEPEQIFLTKEEFRSWGAEHGYAEKRADLAYRATIRTGRSPREDGFPKVDVLQEDDINRAVDLRGIHRRLIATKMEHHDDAWRSATAGEVNFLAHLVNDYAQPDELLPLSREEWRHREWRRGSTS